MDIRLRIHWRGAKGAAVQGALRWIYASRRKLGTGAICALALGLGAHVMLGPNGTIVYQQKRLEYHKLQHDIQDLQKENQRYSEQVKALKSDPQAIEKAAREELRYARPGEVVYVVPSDNRERPATKTAEK